MKEEKVIFKKKEDLKCPHCGQRLIIGTIKGIGKVIPEIEFVLSQVEDEMGKMAILYLMNQISLRNNFLRRMELFQDFLEFEEKEGK